MLLEQSGGCKIKGLTGQVIIFPNWASPLLLVVYCAICFPLECGLKVKTSRSELGCKTCKSITGKAEMGITLTVRTD